MSEENDLSRSAVGLKSLPTLDELVAQLAPSTWNILKPLLARLPLLNLLTEIMQLACRRGGEKEKRPLLDLARLAVSKHQYTNRLYTEIVDAVSSWKPEAAESPLPHLLPQDARLAMEMLSFLAELFRMNGNYEPGVQSFRLAERIADRFGLVLNKAIVFHQLGNYETQHAQLAKAEAAYRIAANLFAPIAPDLEKRSNYQRAVIYKLRLQFEADPSEPEDIESIMARDPKARELVLLARARKAVGRDDLAGADNLLGSLRQSQTNDEIAGEKLVIEARMARRKGEFEKAELLLKQASKISSRSLELNWETFYLARDLGHNEESQAILERLKNESEGLRVDYQKAIVAYNTRDHKTAEKLLRNCLLQATNDTVRADCKAMLALVSDNALEARRIFHEAIGLYVKLDRKLDHAISLSHLATVEFVDALRQKEGGWPKVVLSQFRRADNLLQHAQEITESLGAFSFLLDLIMNRAHFEMKRERYNVALRYFNKAASSLEMTYLSMTDRRSANLFLSTCTPFYSVAISCALASGNESEALFFSERSKARRFLRDAAENTYEGHVDSTHSLFAKERDLLATIQPLRSRLIQQRSLSLQERESLYNAESQLRDLWQTMRQTPEVSNELSKRVHQPVEVSLLRQLVFGEAPVDGKDDKAPVSDEAEEELPGGGVMQCERCFVYNRISSTFCSACCLLLPKSVSVNMNLWTGQASEDELKQAFADNQYNEGSRLFHEGKIAEAEAFFEKAMEYATHPDYSFFYGLCRLGAGDSAAALRSFDDVSEQQFSFKYPFWPLPVSPDDFSDCLTKLRSNPNAAVETLGCLMNAYVDYSEKRQAQHR